MKRRIVSIITALALCLSLCPTWALAEEADPSLCKHHPEHIDCGYIAPTEGHDCGHRHTAECYTKGVLPDADGGDPYEVGADTENLLNCQHSHDSACGYVEADPGAPCGYVCRICPIEDLIAALPEQVTEDNADDVRAQLDEILALYRELDEGEQGQLDLSRCYELQEALDNANAPVQAAEEITINNATVKTLTAEDGDCPGHTFTGTAQRTMIYVASGVHNVTFSNLSITGTANVGIAPGATMNLTIEGTNTIQADYNLAGIYVPVGATLAIQGAGSLDVSGDNSAGIGGAAYAPDESGSDGDPNCGTVEINGGTITATGGSRCAGIGGGTTDYVPGNGGTVTINDGTVTAKGGSDNYYGGAGIGGAGGVSNEWNKLVSGNGGTLTINGGTVNLTAGTHNPQYPAYGFGQGSGSASGGTCELTLTDASYLDSGTTLDPNGKYTINGNPTPDMIVVPEDLIYNGKAQELDRRIYIDESKTGSAEYFGRMFTVNASADGWVLQPLGEVKAAGEYTAVFKKGDKEISKTFTVAKSGTDLTSEGKVQTFNGETATDTFTASDTITVKATPTATGAAPQTAAARLQGGPSAGQMALYVGDALVLSEAADADADGSYTMTVSASDVLTLGGVEPNGDPITLTAKFVGNDNMADGAGTATVNITAAAKAEKDGKVIGYYGESGLVAALANSGNEGAVFTLLDNMERETDLKINISCTLDLNGKTIRSKGEYVPTLSTYIGTAVTIRGEGTVISEQGHGFSVGGTTTLEGGTFISGAADCDGVYVQAGKLIVTGEAVVIENTGGGTGLGVGYNAEAQLSGGTYSSIWVDSPHTLAGLLNQEGASRVAYYKDNTTLVTEGLDGQTLTSGSYTVKACSHIFGSSTTCPACGGEAVARVTIGGAVTHYGDLPSAWAAVQGQTADLYLLKSVDAAGVGKYNRLDLASGSVTLGMAEDVVLSGNSQYLIRLMGGELTLISGTIRNNAAALGLLVTDGTLRVSGGTVEGNNAVIIDGGGRAEITGGTFTGTGSYSFGLNAAGTVKISGGQFSGSSYAVYNRDGTLADLLAEDYAFKKDGNWVTNTSGDSLTGTVTVEPTPVKITAQPVNTSQRYGDMDALSIETSPGQGESVTYQWYVVKASGAEAVSGEIAPVFSPSQNQRLDVGSYQYFCEVTKDGYTQRSNTVTFTVTPRQVNPSITGTAHKEYDGTTNVTDGQLSITLEGVVTGDDVTAVATSYAYDNANAGENKTITVSGITLEGDSKDNYTLSITTATTTGTITKSQPTIAFVSGYNPSKDYDGQTIPNPVADNLTITGAAFGNVDFTWSATPKDAGTYTLTAKIAETNNTKAASATLPVTISPKAVTADSANITLTPSEYEFNGAECKPAVVIKDGGLMIPASEYEVSYSGNINVGTATVTITDNPGGNYTVSGTTTFTITAKPITGATVTVTGPVTYTGSALAPAPTVTLGGQTLVKDTDYTVAYADNTDAGTATITVTGKGNYSGTAQGTFTIGKADLTVDGTGTASGTYGAKLSELTVDGLTAKLNGNVVAGTWKLTGDTVPNVGDSGQYTATFTPATGAGNYNALTAQVTLSIAKANYTGTTTASTSAKFGTTGTYDLSALLPDGATAGTAATDSDIFEGMPAVSGKTLTYQLKAGATVGNTGPITVPVISANYNNFNLTITVTVTAKDVPTLTVSPITVTYTGEAVPGTAIQGTAEVGSTTVPGTWAFASGEAVTNVADSGTKTVKFVPTDGTNYAEATGTVVVTINKATPTGAPKYTAISTSGKTLADAGLTTEGGTLKPAGTVAWVLADTTEVTANTQYEWTFTPTDTANYNTLTGKITLWPYTAPVNPGGGGYVPSNPGGSSLPVTTTGQGSTTTTTAAPTASTQGGTATTTINTTMGNEIVRQATANKSENVVIAPSVTGSVTKAEVSIPASTVGQIGSQTNASLTVSTPVADVTIPNGGLGSLSSAGGTVTVTAEQVGNSVELSVTAGGRTVQNVPGGVTLTVPAANTTPGTVAVLVYEDGTREVVRKSMADNGAVTIPLDGSAKLEIVDNSKYFADVPATSWATDAVAFASAHELFGGTGANQFSPDLPMSRGMLAVVLHNLESNPAQALTGAFADVDNSQWYAEGVAWAEAQGIIGGYGNGRFGPNDNITREQLAVMLWRYAGSPAATDRELHFADAHRASNWALEALRWATENGIINGKGGGILDPTGQATRAETAQMLKNFMESK